MARYRSSLLIAATAVALLTAACAAGGTPAGADSTVATGQANTAQGAKAATKWVNVLSDSFISPSTGWLLGEYGQNGQGASRVLMRKTVDGGKTWFEAPAPPAPAADSSPDGVSSILFTSKSDGWAFGPGLWRTTDGGATWLRESAPEPVTDLTVAGGRVLAVTSRAGSPGKTTSGVYTSAVGTDKWRLVPGTALTGFSGQSLAVSGGTGYLFASADMKDAVLLAGPVTGSGRWRSLPLPQPCARPYTSAIAAAGDWLFIGCGSEPGAGNQLKAGYVSHNGGHTWQKVASPPFGGYLGSATMSPGGTIFLSGQRMDIYISGNRGRSWQESPSLAGAAGTANAGWPLTGATVTSTFGVVIQGGVSTRQVWLTTDGGVHWTPVTVH